jgi:competence protein ComEC
VAAGAIGVLWLLAPRGMPARWVGAVWLLPLLLVRPAAPAPGELWFSLLDVGQGLAAVLRTANHTLVYDTGARFSAHFDAGQAVVVPYLRARGVERVDMLIVSHGDNDHRGGAAAVLRAYPAARVFSSVAALGVAADVRPCREGESWEWDGVRFTLLNPPHGRFSRHNNASCVLKVESAYGSVLLPGDIEARAEARLVAHYGPRLAAAVLVAPHHGSRSSSTEAFIAAVRPRYVLVPAGYRNRYRHPHPEVLARYREAGGRLYGTAASGALELRLTAAGIGLESYRERARRYWHARPDGF